MSAIIIVGGNDGIGLECAKTLLVEVANNNKKKKSIIPGELGTSLLSQKSNVAGIPEVNKQNPNNLDLIKKIHLLILIGKNEAKGKSALAMCKALAKNDEKIVYVNGDISKKKDLASIMQQILRHTKTVDLIFANAGIGYTSTLASTGPLRGDDDYRMVLTNVISHFTLINNLIPYMNKTTTKVIFTVNDQKLYNYTSLPCRETWKHLSYSSSKIAIIICANELARNFSWMNVVLFNPQAVKTAFHHPNMSNDMFSVSLKQAAKTWVDTAALTAPSMENIYYCKAPALGVFYDLDRQEKTGFLVFNNFQTQETFVIDNDKQRECFIDVVKHFGSLTSSKSSLLHFSLEHNSGSSNKSYSKSSSGFHGSHDGHKRHSSAFSSGRFNAVCTIF